jgi:hypothetical protein
MRAGRNTPAVSTATIASQARGRAEASCWARRTNPHSQHAERPRGTRCGIGGRRAQGTRVPRAARPATSTISEPRDCTIASYRTWRADTSTAVAVGTSGTQSRASGGGLEAKAGRDTYSARWAWGARGVPPGAVAPCLTPAVLIPARQWSRHGQQGWGASGVDSRPEQHPRKYPRRWRDSPHEAA